MIVGNDWSLHRAEGASLGQAFGSHINIRLGWKMYPWTSTLAYDEHS
jgi:hypothetical protein